MNLIVGLGNPGRDYTNNRHNAGLICLNHFARTHNIKFDKKQGLARIGTGEIDGQRVVLARPQTYMNLSGQSVSRLVAKYDITPNKLLIIHDDLDLPLGSIRIRQGGSSGGHKGIKSIISYLGYRNFNRLRVGIGRPAANHNTEASEDDIIAYVLGDFTAAEKTTLTEIIDRTSQAIHCLLTQGLTTAMNKYN